MILITQENLEKLIQAIIMSQNSGSDSPVANINEVIFVPKTTNSEGQIKITYVGESQSASVEEATVTFVPKSEYTGGEVILDTEVNINLIPKIAEMSGQIILT